MLDYKNIPIDLIIEHSSLNILLDINNIVIDKILQYVDLFT